MEHDALHGHIGRAHGREHVYLRVNGVIVRDVCVVREALRELELVMLGTPSLKVSPTIDGERKTFAARSSVSLREHIPDGFHGTAKISLVGARRSKEFTIYCGKLPQFRAGTLHDGVRDLQRALARGEQPDWDGFRERYVNRAKSELELRYLNGFLEYSLGCSLEGREKYNQARERLEGAMNLLFPFPTAMAEDARHILALQMNCFASLTDCKPRSRLAPAKVFFLDGVRNADGRKAWSAKADSLEVYIDGFSEALLLACTF